MVLPALLHPVTQTKHYCLLCAEKWLGISQVRNAVQKTTIYLICPSSHRQTTQINGRMSSHLHNHTPLTADYLEYLLYWVDITPSVLSGTHWFNKCISHIALQCFWKRLPPMRHWGYDFGNDRKLSKPRHLQALIIRGTISWGLFQVSTASPSCDNGQQYTRLANSRRFSDSVIQPSWCI